MKEKQKYQYNILIQLITTIVYILLVKFFDVQTIGPRGTKVGFATINNIFHNIFNYNNICYLITKYLGYLTLLIPFIFCFIGLKQLIKRKSLKKVDKKIILLGCFYILIGIVYVFFEKVIINYRPIILEGELEASFPSSHTLLALTICYSTILVDRYYIKDKDIRKIINWILSGIMVILVIGRIISGVHWFSDIVGGIIISSLLLSIFKYFLDSIKE